MAIVRCPICGAEFDDEAFDFIVISPRSEHGSVEAWFGTCTECWNLVVEIEGEDADGERHTAGVVWPRPTRICPPEVPKDLAELHRQATTILYDSPMAAAALSRRCLQQLLREVVGVRHGSLAQEIDQAEQQHLPPYLSQALDDLREIGNFAAHPSKNSHTGEVVEVELHEAVQCVETVEALFRHYFLEPAHAKQRREATNRKLREATKRQLPPL